MVYRIRLKIGYYENWFDFYDVQEATEFAKTILMHQVVNEDCKERRASVSMEIITITEKEEEDE